MELVDIERKRGLTRKLFVWPLDETAGDGSGQGEICGSFFWLAPTERAGRKNGACHESKTYFAARRRSAAPTALPIVFADFPTPHGLYLRQAATRCQGIWAPWASTYRA